jgi:hypothetical protein
VSEPLKGRAGELQIPFRPFSKADRHVTSFDNERSTVSIGRAGKSQRPGIEAEPLAMTADVLN